MKAEYLRDAAMTAVIFGFFGMAWFGWAQEAPPASARKWLGLGSALSVATAIAGGVVSWQHWNDGSAINAETGPRFGIIVGIEFALAGLGAAILRIGKKSEFIAPWIAFVVGVHFFPLITIFRNPLLWVTAVLVTVGAWVSVRVARSRELTVSFVTGLVTGSVLLLVGVISLVQALTAY